MRKAEGKPYRKSISDLLNQLTPDRILDLACGGGWVGKSLQYPATVHGTDLYAPTPERYERFLKADINDGIPNELEEYDCIVCCEAMSYLQNPGVFLLSVRRHLKSDGLFVLSLPNPIYAGARLNYLIQGFPRSYSKFSQNAVPEPHMPWLSLGLFQLWLLLGLNGFKDITVHDVVEKKPKHYWEIPLGLLVKVYCHSRLRKSKSDIERHLWRQAMSDQVIYGRQLVISARRK